jgi:hypothetical protein
MRDIGELRNSFCNLTGVPKGSGEMGKKTGKKTPNSFQNMKTTDSAIQEHPKDTKHGENQTLVVFTTEHLWYTRKKEKSIQRRAR